MLTFESDLKDEKLDIHSDLEGLKYLRSVIDSLIVQSEKNGCEHVHLMTQEWGGPDAGLSSEKQHPDNQIFNHVKIFCWSENENT
ncbi:Immunity protein 32 [Alteromonadaceae bacterium Bs31]|nr:Immunity protein 32 [Alteromonadaceae bacterium Bs31]